MKPRAIGCVSVTGASSVVLWSIFYFIFISEKPEFRGLTFKEYSQRLNEERFL